MKLKFDMEAISKFVVTGIIGAIVIYMLNGVNQMGAGNVEAQADKVYDLIEKALVQCYALEGSYPSEGQFEEKMNKYGVILNHDKYMFFYESFSSNIMPDVVVTPIKTIIGE